MINILGKRKGIAKVEEFDSVMYSRSAHLHVYGKEESKLGRKMGHVTVLGNDIESALERAKNMESQIIL
jgi:5-(carboxyamino)imidazole ribonucleotide synthase